MRIAPRWILLTSVLASLCVQANSGGVNGRSGLTGATCSGCHGSSAGTAPTVTLGGPASLAPGASAEYSLTVAGGPGATAGLNVAIDNAAAALNAIAAGGTKKLAGEITHIEPLAFTAGQAVFRFRVVAPATPGVTLKLYAAGQSCNANGMSSGDREALDTHDISVLATNAPPTVATAASATPNPVTGTTTTVSALGADDGGEPALTYTWSSLGGPAPVTFSPNGTNAARSATASFTQAGSYNLQVRITDAGGLSVTSAVTVTVQAGITTVAVSPNTAGVPPLGTQVFTASARDQFGQPIAPAPSFTWMVSGGGTIAAGLFTAGATPGGPYTVTATAGGRSGTAMVTVSAGLPPTVATPAAAGADPVMTRMVALSVLGADDDGEAGLVYTWSSPGAPAAVTFSANGTNAAKNTSATFSALGGYTFVVSIKDAVGLTATSSVTVQVRPRVATLALDPATVSVPVNGTQPFVLVAKDQFGDPHPNPPPVTWSVTGDGTINTSGVFRAGATPGGPFTVTANTGTRTTTAQVTVTAGDAPSFAQLPSAGSSPVSGRSVMLTALGQDDGGEALLTYTWEAITAPAPVAFSLNGSNAASNVTATFTRAGDYTFEVTVRDGGGQTARAAMEVTVDASVTTLVLSPATAQLQPGATQAFVATATDQFSQQIEPGALALTWSLSGGGSVSDAGLVTARDTAGGPFSVSATTPSGMRAMAVFTVGSAGVDTTPPRVALVNPPAGGMIYRTALVRAEASDDVGVAEVTFLVDGAVARVLTAEPWEFGLSTLELSNGTHQLEARARDAAGNVAQSGVVTVDVQNAGAGGGCASSGDGPGGAGLGFGLTALLALLAARRDRRRPVPALEQPHQAACPPKGDVIDARLRQLPGSALDQQGKRADPLVASPLLSPPRTQDAHKRRTTPMKLNFISAAVLLVASGALVATPSAQAQVQARQRCAIRLSGTILGTAPTAALMSATDPQATVDTMLTSPDFIERFSRFINARFNAEPGETAAEDASYFLTKHILENSRPWHELFNGEYLVRRPAGGGQAQAEVVADPAGLGYFRSKAWMDRYSGNELAGYRLVAAYRIINNTLGVTLTAAANTDGIDAEGRKGAACAGCHYNTTYGLDLIAKILSKKRVGAGGGISYTPPNEGPQILLGGISIANDKQLVNAMVGSVDFRFNACRVAAEFLYGRAEFKCEGAAFDACMAAFPATGDIRSAISALAKHSTYCQ